MDGPSFVSPNASFENNVVDKLAEEDHALNYLSVP